MGQGRIGQDRVGQGRVRQAQLLKGKGGGGLGFARGEMGVRGLCLFDNSGGECTLASVDGWAEGRKVYTCWLWGCIWVEKCAMGLAK